MAVLLVRVWCRSEACRGRAVGLDLGARRNLRKPVVKRQAQACLHIVRLQAAAVAPVLLLQGTCRSPSEFDVVSLALLGSSEAKAK